MEINSLVSLRDIFYKESYKNPPISSRGTQILLLLWELSKGSSVKGSRMYKILRTSSPNFFSAVKGLIKHGLISKRSGGVLKGRRQSNWYHLTYDGSQRVEAMLKIMEQDKERISKLMDFNKN